MAQETELLEFAEQMKPFLREHRDLTETERRIPEVIAQRLVASGVCRMALAADAGGLETDPLVTCQVIEALSWGEASVGWIVWNNALPSYFSRFLSAEVCRDIYADPGTLLASSTRISGRAVAVDGGYRISGRWSLVSGCQLADWIPVMCAMFDGDTPRMAAPDVPDARLLFVPKADYEIIDTWHVTGLRGTGSHDIVVEDVFVPEERCFSWTGEGRRMPVFNTLPIFPIMAAGAACICLGVAQAAFDEFRHIVETKIQADPTPALKLRDEVLAAVAATAHDLETMRTSIHTVVREIRDLCLAGDEVPPAVRGRMFRAVISTARRCKEIISNLHTLAGTPAIYAGSPLERAQRDILAITQHIILQPVHLINAGRAELGITVDSPIF